MLKNYNPKINYSKVATQVKRLANKDMLIVAIGTLIGFVAFLFICHVAQADDSAFDRDIEGIEEVNLARPCVGDFFEIQKCQRENAALYYHSGIPAIHAVGDEYQRGKEAQLKADKKDIISQRITACGTLDENLQEQCLNKVLENK